MSCKGILQREIFAIVCEVWRRLGVFYFLVFLHEGFARCESAQRGALHWGTHLCASWDSIHVRFSEIEAGPSELRGVRAGEVQNGTYLRYSTAHCFQ